MGFFKLKSKNRLEDMQVGDRLEESDFATLTTSGTFVQLEYIEEDEKLEPYKVKPGIWSIQKSMMGFGLTATSFVNDKILEDFVHTKDITDKIDCFFKNIHIYKEYGIEVPKRGMLLYGPPGTGKTTVLNKVCNQYAKDSRTAIIVWHTDKFEAYQVKDFIKSFTYENVDKMILVAEDIGGVEMNERRHPSDSGLLALLDNQEKTFTIPILILATTNFPEVFLGNLTNRPQRFDDKIEVGFPAGEARGKLLKFFSKDRATSNVLELVTSNVCKDFSPAHIKEIVIRSAIYDKDMFSVVQDMVKEIEHYNKAFSKQMKMGF